jgi:flagellar L-ring protein precursor FlgH
MTGSRWAAGLLTLGLFACATPRPAPAPVVLAPTPLSLFTDERASRLGDTVTVQIMENSRGSRRVTSRADKEGNLSADVKTTASGRNTRTNLGLNVTNENNAESGLERRGSLVAAVTAQVVEILPTGNLVIEGRQEITLERGLQTLTVRGIVNPRDIGPGNTVLSTKLASAKISYKSKSEPGIHQRGVIAWLFGWIF